MNNCIIELRQYYTFSIHLERGNMLQEFENLLQEIESIKLRDYTHVTKCISKAKSLVRRLLPSSSHNDFKSEIDNITFSPRIAFAGQSESVGDNVFQDGIAEFKGIVENIRDEYVMLQKIKNPTSEKKRTNQNLKDIFIVHGHNKEMIASTARLIEKIGLNPIILKETADKGRTLIEKFEEESKVDYAIVLFSGDDKFYKMNDKGELEETVYSRTRQNVILEFGYFIGKLGRKHVLVLYKPDDTFEFPSDIDGVIYKEYKNGWVFEIAKELRTFGFDIDMNNL